MLKPNLSVIVQLMRRSVDRMQTEGAVRRRSQGIVRLKEVFPFRPEDVEGVIYEGKKDNVRFQLRNGRIFDANGKLVDQAQMERV